MKITKIDKGSYEVKVNGKVYSVCGTKDSWFVNGTKEFPSKSAALNFIKAIN